MLIESLFNKLMTDPDFFKVCYPHLKSEYFTDRTHQKMFEKVSEYVKKYDRSPRPSDIKLLLETDNRLSEEDTESCYRFTDDLVEKDLIKDSDILLDKVEEYCQQRSLELAIIDSLDILQKDPTNRGSIQTKIEDALSIAFNVQIGHDYYKDAVERFDYYQEQESFVSSGIEQFDLALGGGFVKKSLYTLLGRTNVGKSIFGTHFASHFLSKGMNVLHITAEMSDKRISQRIDANLLDIDINTFRGMDKKEFLTKVKNVYQKYHGKLIVKEYPTSTANMNHVKALLNELRLKKNFKPDVIIFDYLNIFASSRLPVASMSNSYQYIKAIAEEMRAVISENDVIGITFTQTNRYGAKATTDLDETSTAESWGLPQTVDWLGGIIQTPELFEQGKYLIKTIKSRFMDNIHQCYTIGVDRSRMRLYSLEDKDLGIPVHVKDRMRMEQEKLNQNEVDSMFDFTSE